MSLGLNGFFRQVETNVYKKKQSPPSHAPIDLSYFVPIDLSFR